MVLMNATAHLFLLACLIGSATVSGVSSRKKLVIRRHAQQPVPQIRLKNGHRPLSDEIHSNALRRMSYLNEFNDTYFNPRFLKQTDQVRALFDDHPSGKVPPRYISVPGQFNATYFDRGSDCLMVVAAGFTNHREYMAPFLKLFPSYDILLVELPGHGIDARGNKGYRAKLGHTLLGVDIDDIALGEHESAAITNATCHLKQSKQYKTTVGVSRCYSAPFFAQAAVSFYQRNGQKLFDKLVFDSPFTSFAEFVPNFPKLWVGRSKAPIIKHMCANRFVGKGFYYLAQWITGKQFAECPAMTSLLSQLSHTDILLIHSRADVAISMDDFERIWSSLAEHDHSCALITSNPHALNHIKQKELYSSLIQTFIEHPFDQFTQKII